MNNDTLYIAGGGASSTLERYKNIEEMYQDEASATLELSDMEEAYQDKASATLELFDDPVDDYTEEMWQNLSTNEEMIKIIKTMRDDDRLFMVGKLLKYPQN